MTLLDNRLYIYSPTIECARQSLQIRDQITLNFADIGLCQKLCFLQIIFQVVSTVISGILFARFPTVKCVATVYSLLVMSLAVEAGSTHFVLLPTNVVLGKEGNENNSPTHRK